MITTVVLTHNDEEKIGKTLQSLAWCNERIVIDDYSSDKTIVIAEKHGVKIFKRRLNNDFAAQRNYGLEKALGDWVLFVDSDEVVSEQLSQEIQQTLKNSSYDGFFLKRQDVLFGKKLQFGETTAVRLLRLARKSAGKWERPVHEVWNVQGNIVELKNPIIHYPHATMAEFIDDINGYSTQNARLMFDQGKRAGGLEIVAF